MKARKKRRSKNPLRTLKNKLWKLCVELTRRTYGNECYTCGRKGLEGKNWHTGHFIPKKTSGAFLKFDTRNLRPQCYNCNINLGGNGAEFMRKMLIREGQDYVDQLFRDKSLITKEKDFYPMLFEKYKLMLDDLQVKEKSNECK